MRRGALGRALTTIGLAICVGLAAVAIAAAEVAHWPSLLPVAQGTLRPAKLPRNGQAPVALSLSAKWNNRGPILPRLATMVLGLDRNLSIRPNAVPVCGRAKLEATSMRRAGQVCGRALVGRGRAGENAAEGAVGAILVARLEAFNGRVGGRPAILVHGAFGAPYAPTPFTIAFRISRGRGTFPTLLSAQIPPAAQDVGPLVDFELDLGDSRGAHRREYLIARCPAPSSFRVAVFRLLRLELGFEGGLVSSEILEHSCRVR